MSAPLHRPHWVAIESTDGITVWRCRRTRVDWSGTLPADPEQLARIGFAGVLLQTFPQLRGDRQSAEALAAAALAAITGTLGCP